MCSSFSYYYMLWSQDHSLNVESCTPVFSSIHSNHPSFNYNVYSNVLFREWYWKVLFGLLFCWILSTSSSTLLQLTLSFFCVRTVSDLLQQKRKVYDNVIASKFLLRFIWWAHHFLFSWQQLFQKKFHEKMFDQKSNFPKSARKSSLVKLLGGNIFSDIWDQNVII